jgi:glycosyl transferase family 25
MLPAYVINLDRSPDRLAAMRREFSRVGVDFRRFSGVDAARFSPDELSSFFARRPSFTEEDRHPGNAGVLLSHLGVWRAIAGAGDEFAAVFEDDVHLASDLTALLRSADWIPEDADLVRLEANNAMVLRGGGRIAVAPKRKVFRAVSNAWGTADYVVSRRAAEKLASAPESLHIHADWMLFKPSRSPVAAGLVRYQVLPAVCVQDELLNGTRATLRTVAGHGGQKLSKRPRVLHWVLPNRKRPVPFLP